MWLLWLKVSSKMKPSDREKHESEHRKKPISGITMDVLDYQCFFANLQETNFQNRLSFKCEIILCLSLSWKNPSVWLGKKLSLKLEIDQTWKRFSRIGTFSGFLLETKWSTFQRSTPLQGWIFDWVVDRRN